MSRKRKQRVPEVLWRVFGKRARTLGNTLISLVNRPSPLLLSKPDDPVEYRKLLNHSYVVLSESDELSTDDLHFENRWPQPLIVRRTIEIIIREQPFSRNVLCSGYDKCHQSSAITELLITSAWSLLLERIGDQIMTYLLKHTSIFLPFPPKKHQQVAGPPISTLVFKSSRHVADSSSSSLGSKRKRDWINDASTLMFERPQLSAPCTDVLRYKKPFGWQRRKKSRQTCSGNECSSHERLLLEFSNSSRHCPGKMLPRFCCHLVLQASQPFMKGVQINRQPIFYNSEHFSSVLPGNHVLNCLKPNSVCSKSLILSIFCLSDKDVNAPPMPVSSSNGFCLIGSACLYHSLVKLVKVLIRQTQCCKHLRLMDRHCFISSLNQNSNSMFEGDDLKRKFSENFHDVVIESRDETLETVDPHTATLKSYCSKSQAVSFIWAVCRNVVPPDLLGSTFNQRILRRNISKFICLQKFEKFSLKQCMHKLKASEFLFLSDKHSSCCLDTQLLNNVPGQNASLHKGLYKWTDAANDLKHLLLQKWIYWFFSFLVVPLVKANFYVTETEHGKHEIYYYKKSMWEKLRNRAISCLKEQEYRFLDIASVESIISRRSFGFSKLRLLPKKHGIRILANLTASSRLPAKKSASKVCSFGMQSKAQFVTKAAKCKHLKSVNCVLRDVHAVLKGIQLKTPEKLGSSVFDYNGVYQKLCQFIIDLKERSTKIPNVFFVVSDVSKAFDSIDQDKLLSVMEDVISEDQYLLKQFYQVVSTKKSLWAHEHLMARDQNIITCFKRYGSSSFGRLHTVLVHQGCGRHLKKKQLLFNLTEHVKSNVLQFEDKFYLQCKGIPQGSILSSLLCSLYYGHLEKNVIYPFLKDLSRRDCHQDASAVGTSSRAKVDSSPHYVLLRFIDDFLFVSTSKKLAASFFFRVQSGFGEYNCFMNEKKFCLNFDTASPSGLCSDKLFVGEDGISFVQWSGLLLNSRTLEVQADYTRYLNNHLRSTLTVCWQGKPYQHLKRKLCHFVRPKCHPVFFDSNINSAPVVRLNIYQAFLLCAMKFHCYASDLSKICSLHVRFIVKIIERSLRYMYVLIRRRMHSVLPGSYFRPVLQLDGGEVEWLGLNAYIQVLKRKQSRYRELLSLLRSKLSTHRIGGSLPSPLRYAVDTSHSSLIWKIKY